MESVVRDDCLFVVHDIDALNDGWQASHDAANVVDTRCNDDK